MRVHAERLVQQCGNVLLMRSFHFTPHGTHDSSYDSDARDRRNTTHHFSYKSGIWVWRCLAQGKFTPPGQYDAEVRQCDAPGGQYTTNNSSYSFDLAEMVPCTSNAEEEGESADRCPEYPEYGLTCFATEVFIFSRSPTGWRLLNMT